MTDTGPKTGNGTSGTGPRTALSSPTVRYVLRRLLQAALVMVLVMVGSFLLVKLAPGDFVDALAGTRDLTADQIAELRARYGLDQPVFVQLIRYMSLLATFDFGYSPINAAPVMDVILARLPVTAILVVASVTLSMVVGTVFSVIASRNAGRPLDLVISIFMLLLYATPSFIIAVLMILVFSVHLGWLPIAGFESVGMGYTGWTRFWDVVEHLTMPVIALCTFYIAIYGRIGRASMLEVLKLDFVRTARGKGLTEHRIFYVHALRNALLPLVTMAGLQVSSLMGGAVLIETIFGLPGMGRTAFDAVFQRDTNLLLGVVFMSSLCVVIVNYVIDMLYMVLDPRVNLK
ncbi:ABC transporter permease [Tropicimonas isoalkanivorans]|uniref:Peptide/nickel transport system permease protein n=1 Tax=Tropicimonas isoalkanivorans TaxID=441112 RepID=A0A1I1KPN3_9RHOB|nr:ABC transporter permease [Tropicimonas isoalkanivorans]SFC62747.1 peptide/nickel transport system permease protein [Tropicimonas isoalkanivorans]